MAQNVLKLHDRGVDIELILTDESYIHVNGVLVFGRPPVNTNLLVEQKMKLIKREPYEKTGVGTKAHDEAKKYVTEFESKFDKEFLTKSWNVVMDNLRFRNIVFQADYYKMLPQDKPVGAIVQSTKKFLLGGICEENQENISAIRNMFAAYIVNCDKYYSTDDAPKAKTIITKVKPTTDWTSRAKEVNDQK